MKFVCWVYLIKNLINPSHSDLFSGNKIAAHHFISPPRSTLFTVVLYTLSSPCYEETWLCWANFRISSQYKDGLSGYGFNYNFKTFVVTPSYIHNIMGISILGKRRLYIEMPPMLTLRRPFALVLMWHLQWENIIHTRVVSLYLSAYHLSMSFAVAQCWRRIHGLLKYIIWLKSGWLWNKDLCSICLNPFNTNFFEEKLHNSLHMFHRTSIAYITLCICFIERV